MFRKFQAMSYSLFNREWVQRNKERDKMKLPYLTWDEANEIIIDNWMKQKKFSEIVNYVLENWDTGNGDKIALPILDKFIEQKEVSFYIRFWKGILKQRMENVWSFSGYEPTEEVLKYLENLDLSDFNPFSNTEPSDRQLAYYRKFTLDGINRYIDGLRKIGLNEEVAKAEMLYEIVSKLQKPIPKPASDNRKIDENLFWLLIDESRFGASNSADFIDNLRNKLERFQSKELKHFDKCFLNRVNELNSWDQWALAYMVRGGCGDDEFDYYKAWVVSLGKEAFESIKIIDESKLIFLFSEDPQLEELYYLAADIYESRTGDIYDPPEVKQQKITGVKWSEEKIKEAYPRLHEIFNSPFSE